MGGSIGRAIKKRKLADNVVGYFRRPQKIKEAIRLGCVDEGTSDLSKAVEETDLVILCSPVDDIIAKLRTLKGLVSPLTLITDAGSTKSEILKAARGLNFIGAHPIAGSEQSGLKSSSCDLFNHSVCVLTPPKKFSRQSFERISRFWQALGSTTAVMNADKHDAILGFTSHLPHAAAYALIQSVPKKFYKFAGGGLKDSTRIALSRADIWCAIFLSNKKNLVKAIQELEKSLRECRNAIHRGNRKKLLRWLTQAQEQRRSAFSS
jgi:cyclohexadieny/prephenate dehydrogenase